MEWSADQLRVLRRVLSELFPRENDQRRVVSDLDLNAGIVDFSGIAENAWLSILKIVKNRGELERLLAYAAASDEGRGNKVLTALTNGEPLVLREGPKPDWRGNSGAVNQIEKIIGSKSTLVPVRYLALGVERSKAIAKIRLNDGFGSGFLVEGDRILTNHHVLPTKEEARMARAWFEAEEIQQGELSPGVEVAFEPETFFRTSEGDDWTLVAVASGTSEKWPPIKLVSKPIRVNDLVNIIQHPLGGHKMVSLEPRGVVYTGEGRLQYLTDTQPGSSGSPVFDLEWDLVGLHHSGGCLEEPSSSSGRKWLRNEGILIECILKAL